MGEGADMISFNGNSLSVTDKHSAGYQYPSADDSQDLEVILATKVKEGAYAYFQVRRPLDTGDDEDFVVQLNKEFDGGWAAHSESAEETIKHNIAGSFYTTLKEILKEPSLKEPEKPDKDDKEEVSKTPAEDSATLTYSGGWMMIAAALTTLLAF